MSAMLTGPQYHPVDCILVHLQEARGGSNANSLSRVMDDLSDRLGRQMQAKQGAGLGGGKALATGAAVKQIATFVLAVLAANCNVALTAQAVILALFVWTETLLKFAHRLPPVQNEFDQDNHNTSRSICQLIGDITKKAAQPLNRLVAASRDYVVHPSISNLLHIIKSSLIYSKQRSGSNVMWSSTGE